MFDFLEAVRTYLQANVTPIINYGVLNTSASAISIRPTPTGPGQRYMQGQNTAVNFQILVKDPMQNKIMETFDTIVSLLDGKTEIPGVANLVNIELYTSPNFVEKTTSEYIYTAIFSAELEGVN